MEIDGVDLAGLHARERGGERRSVVVRDVCTNQDSLKERISDLCSLAQSRPEVSRCEERSRQPASDGSKGRTIQGDEGHGSGLNVARKIAPNP